MGDDDMKKCKKNSNLVQKQGGFIPLLSTDNEDTIKIVAGGDVHFDLVVRSDPVVSDLKLRHLYQKALHKILQIIGRRFDIIGLQGFPQFFINKAPSEHQRKALLYNFSFEDEKDMQSFPLSKIDFILKSADITFVNLETSLAENCRVVGTYSFIGDPIFADSLSNAGIDVVSIANNHIFDAGEKGFLDTINNLEKRNIRYIGGGRNLKDARTAVIFNVKGTKIAFLGYTQVCNHNFTSVANDDQPGILPFSLPLIIEDIKIAKKENDLVCVSIHWGIENTQKIHPKAVKYAHRIIDAGADIIIGHHPHVPQGIEIYKNRPIFYSLGNFIFGHNHENWQDNLLIEICIQNKQSKKVEILPISGRGGKAYQPELLLGDDAKRVLLNSQKLSSKLNTTIDIVDNKGIIVIP